MYTFISIAVVVLTTFAIGLVFKRKGLNDLRYYLGLGCSAVTAIIASLFFPDIISFTAVDLGLQIVLAFFIL